MSADNDSTLHHRIGQLTRQLHDALQGLGFDRKISAAVESLPDARDRLSYVASLTGQAAERVLCAVERAQAGQARVADDAAALAARWESVGSDACGAPAVIGDTRSFLQEVQSRTAATQADLHEIMMAQDFHDLTGQVLNRIAGLAHAVEASLVELLFETRPLETRPPLESLCGPAIRKSDDVAADQGEVDELLASLGF